MNHEAQLERRSESIPAAVVTHIENKFYAHAAEMRKVFMDHTAEEMERYEEIISKIDKNAEESRERHKDLHDLVKGNCDQIKWIVGALTDAFPADKRGNPDFSGHAKAHENWIEEAKSTNELKAYIQKVVLAAALIAVGSWVAALIWQGVLNGPAR